MGFHTNGGRACNVASWYSDWGDDPYAPPYPGTDTSETHTYGSGVNDRAIRSRRRLGRGRLGSGSGGGNGGVA